MGGFRLRLGLIAVGIGLGLSVCGWESISIASKTKETPATITAAQLSQSGPPKDNYYVHVTNYGINNEYILERKEGSSTWEYVWLQLLPPQGATKDGKPVILKDASINSEDELREFFKKDSFDGIVANGVLSIKSEKAPAGLNFPDVDINKQWIVVARTRPSMTEGVGLFGGGIVSILLGALFGFRFGGVSAKPRTVTSNTLGSRKNR